MSDEQYRERWRAIHQLRGGKTAAQVADGLGRHLSWVYKWQARYREGGWEALKDRSRAPKHPPQRVTEEVKWLIRETRSALEAEAREPAKLSYIGSQAIRSRLSKQKVSPLPSLSSIERELSAAGMVRPRQPTMPEVNSPHLKPTHPHELVQVDIVPHYLPGGTLVSCFNALDVVSRYPTGQQSLTKHSEDAVDFLLHVWRELGLPDYTQVDNEGCFSGGFTHAYVLGRVLRLGLWVGTQLIYSPVRHPESNSDVERFQQDYNLPVWDKLDLPDLCAVQTHSPAFFAAYRHSQHQSALQGLSPAAIHLAHRARCLPADLCLPARLPLTVGKVHFIRRVDDQRSIRVLNVPWSVDDAHPDQGVWATLDFTLRRATLAVYHAAPGFTRRRLALHPFPLKEPVLPLQDCFRSPSKPSLALRSLQWLSAML